MKILSIILTIALLVTLMLQHHTLREIRAENEQLAAKQAEADQLKSDLAQIENQAHFEGEVSDLQAENRELPKLRNEVRQLREQKQQLEMARSENERLQVQALTPAAAGASLISSEELANAGFATPEDTVKTWLWAQSQTNWQVLQQCSGVQEQTRDAAFPPGMTFPGKIVSYEILTQKALSETSVGLAAKVHFRDSVGDCRYVLRWRGNRWVVSQFSMQGP